MSGFEAIQLRCVDVMSEILYIAAKGQFGTDEYFDKANEVHEAVTNAVSVGIYSKEESKDLYRVLYSEILGEHFAAECIGRYRSKGGASGLVDVQNYEQEIFSYWFIVERTNEDKAIISNCIGERLKEAVNVDGFSFRDCVVTH